MNYELGVVSFCNSAFIPSTVYRLPSTVPGIERCMNPEERDRCTAKGPILSDPQSFSGAILRLCLEMIDSYRSKE